MIIEARTLGSEERIEADVAIVGAGAAGITLARALDESGLTVCLLESGYFEPRDETTDLAKGEMVGIDTWTPHGLRGRWFGGSTNLWAGWCRPLEASDFEVQPWIDHSGWPITRRELDPYYVKAHETCQIGAYSYDAESIAGELGLSTAPLAGDSIETAVYRYSPPTRFGTVYRPAIESSTSVTAYLGANVIEIATNDRGDQVTELRCAVLDGPRFAVRAKRYVLSMGGLEIPRLLLASRGTRSEGVANSSGLVGRCFMEHPHYYSSAIWLSPPAELGFYLGQNELRSTGADGIARQVRVMGALTLSEAARREEGVPHFALQCVKLKEERETGELGKDDVRSALLRGPAQPRAGLYAIHMRAEQSPFLDSRLTLSSSEKDALGLPRLRLNWQIKPGDLRALARGYELMGAAFAASGFGRLWAKITSGALPSAPLPGGHHMGAARMSADPDRGVVDGDCRTHDVENLYLAGCATFATGGFANPTLTITALAHRLADHLESELSQ